MRHLDLFSGIGGFKLAAEWAGMETVAFCEIDEWCSRHALKENWPDIPNLGSIKTLCRRRGDDLLNCSIHHMEFGNCSCIGGDEFYDTYGPIDIITAGVPCQPASIIGKRKGAEDDRWLWPEMHRIVEETTPAWVVCEQPTGILSLDRGDRFAEILERFQQAGYSVWWETIPASAVGGGHRRERVWITAYRGGPGLEGYSGDDNSYAGQEREKAHSPGPTAPPSVFPLRDTERWWEDKSPVPVVVHGVSSPSFWKKAVIATGNAIVPQVAFTILKGIADIERQRESRNFDNS